MLKDAGISLMFPFYRWGNWGTQAGPHGADPCSLFPCGDTSLCTHGVNWGWVTGENAPNFPHWQSIFVKTATLPGAAQRWEDKQAKKKKKVLTNVTVTRCQPRWAFWSAAHPCRIEERFSSLRSTLISVWCSPPPRAIYPVEFHTRKQLHYINNRKTPLICHTEKQLLVTHQGNRGGEKKSHLFSFNVRAVL